MYTDLPYILRWWVMLFVIGVVFLPVTSLIFKNFLDRGYAFSKIIGILLVSYLIWLSASFKLLTFSYENIILVLVLLALGNIFLLKRSGLSIKQNGLWKIFLLEEALLLGGLLFWSYIRAHEPSIHGLEKYMDFGFINSILRSDYFPPKDLWLTPETINYYYFGHLSAAVLTRISKIDPAITYNLILATIFGLSLSASFSLGANLYSRLNSTINMKLAVLTGLIAAFLMNLAGNLHTIYAFFKSYPLNENPLPFWQLPLEVNLSGYWYPNATRFIPNTIHEFPIYSYVVADLHGHVFNIPFVLLAIALLADVFFFKLNAIRYTLLSFLIAVFLMTNVLDGPIYLIVIATLLFFKNLATYLAGTANQLASIKKSLLKTLPSIAIMLSLAVLFSLPFWLTFKPFASGVGVLCAPKFLTDLGRLGPLLFEADHCARSPFWMMAVLWGFFYSVTISFLFLALQGSSLRGWWSKISSNRVDYLVIVLALASTILIILPEFLYAKDIYPAHWRANTVFKFGYQAFMLLSLASAYMLVRTLLQKPSKLLFISLALLFSLVSIYPYFAIRSYYGELKTYKSLDGLKYLAGLYPEDYQAILWLNKNVPGQPVILEAQGDSYTDFARVSANTGLPTVVGWPVHEWLWRGSYDEAGKRSEEVRSLYENPDPSITEELIKKYNIKYVFIGTLERQKYAKLDENKFYNLGEVVFKQGQTTIYKLIF